MSSPGSGGRRAPEIAEQLARGTYRVPSEQVAAAIINRLCERSVDSGGQFPAAVPRRPDRTGK